MLPTPMQILLGLATLLPLAQASPFLGAGCSTPGFYYCNGNERIRCRPDSTNDDSSKQICLTSQICQPNGGTYGAICANATMVNGVLTVDTSDKSASSDPAQSPDLDTPPTYLSYF